MAKVDCVACNARQVLNLKAVVITYHSPNDSTMASISSELTTRTSIQTFLEAFHTSTAALDARSTVEQFFTSDIECQYANNPLAVGANTVQSFFDTAFNALDSMTHKIVYFDFIAPDKLYQAATIRYVVKGDDADTQMIIVPAMMTAWLREENGQLKIRRNEIYLDTNRLFGRMAEKGLI